MNKTKVSFLEDLLFSSQSDLLKTSDGTDWLDKKPALQKSHFF